MSFPDTLRSEKPSRKRTKTDPNTSIPLSSRLDNGGNDRAAAAAAITPPPRPRWSPLYTETGATGKNSPLQPVPPLDSSSSASVALRHRSSKAAAAAADTPFQSGDLSTALLRPAPSAKFLRPHVFGGVMGASVGGDGHALALGPHHFATSFPASLPAFCAPRFLAPMCPLQLESFRHAFGAVPPT